MIDASICVILAINIFYCHSLSVNDREAGDMRRHRAHYDVIVMSVSLALPLRQIQCGAL